MRDITFHYTNPEMVKDLVALLPIETTDFVLDAGSGKNKVWFNEIKDKCFALEREIKDGKDFMEWDIPVQWVIGNPPYHIGWKFTKKATEIAQKGIAWLVNNTEMNSLFTPRRQQIIRDAGFYLQRIHIVADKRWFGRYYFLIFTKEPNTFISWNTKTY